LGGDYFPNGIRRPFSTLLRKVGFADRIYLCGALIHFRRGKSMHGEENATAVGGLPKASALTEVSKHLG
jgi:hypothetical protein